MRGRAAGKTLALSISIPLIEWYCSWSLQRQLRLSDAKLVEQKAARIKDWVTNKLRDLEEQNEHLKAQNERANAQMEILRQKLEQLQIDRDSAAASSAAASNAADPSMVEVNAKKQFEAEVSEKQRQFFHEFSCLARFPSGLLAISSFRDEVS